MAAPHASSFAAVIPCFTCLDALQLGAVKTSLLNGIAENGITPGYPTQILGEGGEFMLGEGGEQILEQ